MDLIELLSAGIQRGASDLHLSAGAPPLWRVHGDVIAGCLPGAEGPVAARDVEAMIRSVLDSEQQSRFDQEKELDFAVQVRGVGRFRGNAYQQMRGPAAAFRAIPERIPTVDDLGMPSTLKNLALLKRGLVLVTGPTGSGKSTTLAAMVDHHNRNRAGHILTIEDPVEFVHRPRGSLVSQREVGTHTHGFAPALRSALREDPDVLLVGEMRDLETIALAITAAETGHLVFGTLHTSGAAKTIDRVVGAFPEGEQAQIRTMLAGSLAGVVSQALLPRSDRAGRVAAQEILVTTPAVAALIREGKIHQLESALQTGRRFGMQSMEQALTALMMRGMISREVADHHRGLDAESDATSAPRASPDLLGRAPEVARARSSAQRTRRFDRQPIRG